MLDSGYIDIAGWCLWALVFFSCIYTRCVVWRAGEMYITSLAGGGGFMREERDGGFVSHAGSHVLRALGEECNASERYTALRSRRFCRHAVQCADGRGECAEDIYDGAALGVAWRVQWGSALAASGQRPSANCARAQVAGRTVRESVSVSSQTTGARHRCTDMSFFSMGADLSGRVQVPCRLCLLRRGAPTLRGADGTCLHNCSPLRRGVLHISTLRAPHRTALQRPPASRLPLPASHLTSCSPHTPHATLHGYAHTKLCRVQQSEQTPPTRKHARTIVRSERRRFSPPSVRPSRGGGQQTEFRTRLSAASRRERGGGVLRRIDRGNRGDRGFRTGDGGGEGGNRFFCGISLGGREAGAGERGSYILTGWLAGWS